MAYAKSKNISVIPEFEMPAHCDCWGYSFPSIVSAGYNISNPNAQFDLTNPLTKTVLGQMFDDMLGQGRYFEDSQYVHLGADEVAMTWPNARALYTDFENTFL